MDSLDAQCLLIQLAEGELPPPELWRHDRSGELSCRYEDATRVFTWRPEEVARMARRWRNSDPIQPPELARSFVAAHERLIALTDEAGLGPADVVTHDCGRGELEGIWADRKLKVVVEQIGEAELTAQGEGTR